MNKRTKKRIGTFGTLFTLGVLASGCATTNAFMKDIQASTTGLHRRVTVYSENGEIIREYEGKNMTVSDGDGGTIIIDFEGKRVTFCNSSVIIEEVGAE